LTQEPALCGAETLSTRPHRARIFCKFVLYPRLKWDCAGLHYLGNSAIPNVACVRYLT
jgi:hypothetical protein